MSLLNNIPQSSTMTGNRSIFSGYRERLRMPKLMISGASDEFFAPDSNRFFFDELPGQNYIL